MRKCFVITPIGDSSSEIRRHIEGIIDQSIIPALVDKYEVEVAHRKFEIGSINDRVMKDVYNADLIVANLTGLNPNVMFELAMRYSFGKPAIVIAEEGTKLPFDIIDENTIFYVNDPAGANDLKNQIMKFENNIDWGKKYGPIYKAISTIPLYEEVESRKEVSSETMLSYIIDRLNSIESYIGPKNEKVEKILTKALCLDFKESNNKELRDTIINMVFEKYNNIIAYVTSSDEGINVGLKDTCGKKMMKIHVEEMVEDIKSMGVEQLSYTLTL